MKTVQRIGVCALLGAWTALAVYVILLVRAATATVAALPPELAATRAALLGEVRAARGDVAGQVEAARHDVLRRSERQVAALRNDAMTRIDAALDVADRRIGDTLARADTALGTAESLRQDLKPAFEQSAAVVTQVNEALPLFLDCDHNSDCVFNRYVGVSKGIERAAMNFGLMSQDVRLALPGALANFDSMTRDSAGVAANLNRLTKPRWYDRLLGYGLNGVIIYRNLNPATNLTVKGAQVVSGRP